MKITKYAHSCLLVEEADIRVVIDPGVFSWREFENQLTRLNDIDYLLITHLHPDHMHLPVLKKMQENSPELKIIAASDAAKILHEAGIQTDADGDANINWVEEPHAELWGGMPTPKNVQFTIFEQLTHVGDTHSVVKTAPVLAMPVYAPWGSTKNAIAEILRLKPQKVVPIHDWFWSEAGKSWHYDLLQNNLEPEGIELIRPVDGEPFEA